MMILLLWFWDTEGYLSMTPSRRKLIEQLTQKSEDDDDGVAFIHNDGLDQGDN